MKNAVVYARYSSERQNEQSIEGQLNKCKEFAQQNDLNIVDTYIDRAMTGTNDNRPAFQKMLTDCTKPVIWDIVLVYAIDRFGRNSIEIAVNKQKLKKNGKTLISATQRTSENIDGTKNLDGILLENVYIGLAEYYSAELSQKILRGLNENRRKGLFCGGVVAYGYKVVNKKVVINEDEADIVKYIFKEYSSGRYAKDIMEELDEKGINHRGKPFAMNTFYGLLRRTNYIGISTHGGKQYNNIYPAILSKELFEEVQVILAKNKKGSRSVIHEFILRDKLFCGYCGHTMQGECGTARNGEVKRYYKCAGIKRLKNGCKKSNPKQDFLEDLVINTTLNLFSDNMLNCIADKIIELRNNNYDSNAILNILNDEYNTTNKALNNIVGAIEQGLYTETTKRRMLELEAKLDELNGKIQMEQYKQQTRLTADNIINYIKIGLRKQRKALIRYLIQKIILFDDKIEIYYNYTDKKSPDCYTNETFSCGNGSTGSLLVEMTGVEPVSDTDMRGLLQV